MTVNVDSLPRFYLADKEPGRGRMANYRCYFLDFDGHIVAVEELRGCTNDAASRQWALDAFAERGGYSGVEVWDRSRQVFEYSRLGAPLLSV